MVILSPTGQNLTSDNYPARGGGSAWQQNSDSANAKIFEAQAKTVLVEGLAERLDIALAVAYEHQRMANEREHSWQLNLPITTELNHPAWLWHNNLGSAFDSRANHWQLTWGTGVEHEFSDNLSFYAELFGESGERANVQISSGYWFKPETLQLTLGVGDSINASRQTRWVSLGLNWVIAR